MVEPGVGCSKGVTAMRAFLRMVDSANFIRRKAERLSRRSFEAVRVIAISRCGTEVEPKAQTSYDEQRADDIGTDC